MIRNRNHSFLFALLAVLGGGLLTGCPTDGRRDSFGYLRTPVTFRMDPVAANHPFCLDADRRMPGMTEAQCLSASKFRLHWERPEDTTGFQAYRIYVDTTPPDSDLPWRDVFKESSLASFVLEGPARPSDSIIFVLADSGSAPELSRASPRIVALDTSGRLESTGRLVFAIVATYATGDAEGPPRITWVITEDRFPPYPMQPSFTPRARTMEVDWVRPGDPTSFFDPEADTGIVLAYYLRIVRSGKQYAGRPGTFDPTISSYLVGGVDRTDEVDSTHFVIAKNGVPGQSGAPGRLFRLPDSSRVQFRNSANPLDSLRVVISGLSPQDTVDLTLWAEDGAGNVLQTDTVASAYTRRFLTDTTQPTTPQLRVLDSTRNGFVYAFTASRDLVPSGGGLAPAPNPNANIEEYRITRRRISGPAAGAAELDSVFTVRAAQRDDTLFTDTVRYLAPGAGFRLVVRSVDSTGYVSEADSADVSTLETRFPGPDSAATCPPGFVAIPGGRFLFGDTGSASTADERPSVNRVVKPYCIEAYEHRDSSGAFVTSRTWQQAHDVCRDLSASMTPGDSTWLCTEAEWERACEGGAPDLPLLYGIQSEKSAPGNIRFACNIGTGDSLMAVDPALRDPNCISYEGAFDMADNLAEWVLDPVTLQASGEMAAYPATPDTIPRGAPHTPVTSESVRGFRGSHYLNPNQSPAVLLARARCSNRDYATQSRPQAYAGCIDPDGPQILITYNASKPPRCLPLPADISAADVDTVTTSRDSSVILILLHGKPEPVRDTLPFDTVYNAAGVKPVSAGLTRRTMAIVTFRNEETSQTVTDTLHAAELLGASPATLDAIFRREAAPPWSVVKNGSDYDIRYVYAHVRTRNVPAKSYYSNPALGFRCCSRPRPAP